MENQRDHEFITQLEIITLNKLAVVLLPLKNKAVEVAETVAKQNDLISFVVSLIIIAAF